jgi:hypothetical protein
MIKSGKAEAESVAAERRRPEQNVDSEEFTNGHALNCPVDGIFDDENCEVNTGSEPSELEGISILWKP